MATQCLSLLGCSRTHASFEVVWLRTPVRAVNATYLAHLIATRAPHTELRLHIDLGILDTTSSRRFATSYRPAKTQTTAL